VETSLKSEDSEIASPQSPELKTPPKSKYNS